MISLQQQIRHDTSDRPRAANGKELISVRFLLQWAFGTEFASLEYDEVQGSIGHTPSSVGMEYRIMQQLALGTEAGVGVCVDTSVGRSLPHDDAELVATVVRNAVPWYLAIRVAELARAARAPDWGETAKPRCEPAQWRQCKHGMFAKTDRVGVIHYSTGRHVRKFESRICPVIYRDTAHDIAAKRRAYLDWWGALLYILADLKHIELAKFEITDALPPMEPWKKIS